MLRLRKRVRELELRLDYDNVDDLAEAIRRAVEEVARLEAEGARTRERQHAAEAAEERLIELVRYAGRSGLLK